MRLRALKPEIVHIEGNALVPAKAVSYVLDANGKIVETVKPRTHAFENELKAKMRSELKGISLFPTKNKVFVSIICGLNSSHEYENLDLDNRVKTILDALKEVVYEDDKQVKVLLADKIFLKHKPESYFQFSIKVLDEKTERLLYRHLSKIGR
ncbi:MAG: RusA family crossover junction endodeoxyribonuclease [bacterium]